MTIDTSSDSTLGGKYTNGQCSFPELISFEFLTYGVGYKQGLQNYIVSARRTIQRKYVIQIVTKPLGRTWTSLTNRMITVSFSFKDMKQDEDEEALRYKFATDDGARDFVYPFVRN